VIPNDLNRRNMKNPLDSLLDFMFDPSRDFVVGIKTTNHFHDRRDIDSLQTVWQIERKEIENGDPIESKLPVRLRNVLYNVYLKVIFTEKYLKENGLKYTSERKIKPVKKGLGDVNEGEGVTVVSMLISRKDYDISLTRDFRDTDTIFEILPLQANAENDYISLNSLVRIRHKTTGAFIKIDDDNRIMGINTTNE
jgi:hypothetical protein